MKALILPRTVSLSECHAPLKLVELPRPQPDPGQILIRVAACGVCHTELDEIEGRMEPSSFPIVLGHEVVGFVEATGSRVSRHEIGDRVGVGWIHCSTGRNDENLSAEFRATGRDVNGGYAEFMTVSEHYAYSIPDIFTNAEAAPLLCAGAIGYRALRLTNMSNGDRLGLTGFGGSGHLVLQLARHLYPDSNVYVFARDAATQKFARQLGAVWAGATTDRTPEPLDAVIDTTPAWQPVIEALANLNPGGRLVINAIRKEDTDKSRLLDLSYQDHLWMEREIKTVANITQHDIREFLPLAAQIPIRPHIEEYAFQDANSALLDLRHKNVQGAKVLIVNDLP